jgi:hypothetical protein
MKKQIFVLFWVILAAIVSPRFADAGLVSDSAFSILEICDFNGDANPDILRGDQSTGQLVISYRDGANLVGEDVVATVDGSWSTDVVLKKSTTGEIEVSLMVGGNVVDTATISPLLHPWNIKSVGDYNGDGSSDILWRNSATGEAIIWFMRGMAIPHIATISQSTPSSNFVGCLQFDGIEDPDVIYQRVSDVCKLGSRFTVGFHTSTIVSSLCIRAPPILPLYF